MQRSVAYIIILTAAMSVVAVLAISALPVIHAAAVIVLAAAAAVLGIWPALTHPAQGEAAGRWRAADCVTCLRLGLLLVVIAAGLSHPGPGFGWTAVVVAIPMLALDLVDGLIARATGPTPSGARFDERVDATVVLVLSAGLVPLYGAWCLICGLAHFAFRAIGTLRPAWQAPLAPSWRRKIVAAFQGPLLLAAGSPPGLAVPLFGWVCALAAVVSLLVSFGLDIAAAERSDPHRQAGRHPRPRAQQHPHSITNRRPRRLSARHRRDEHGAPAAGT